MRLQEIEVLSDACNAWVVQTPGRKFPGMILQGDSLSTLYRLTRQVHDLLAKNDIVDAQDVVLQLEDQIADYLVVYEKTMKSFDRELPYPGSIEQERLPE